MTTAKKAKKTSKLSPAKINEPAKAKIAKTETVTLFRGSRQIKVTLSGNRVKTCFSSAWYAKAIALARKNPVLAGYVLRGLNEARSKGVAGIKTMRDGKLAILKINAAVTEINAIRTGLTIFVHSTSAWMK